ncbi:MAG TPA: tetratricopeptide repeat protein [Burkholderiales bacterium]
MSIINRMLRELDRRRAGGEEGNGALRSQVRVVSAPSRSSGEWFWRVVAMLLFAAAGWTVWVIYQLQPRAVATELAHRAAEGTRRRASVTPVGVASPGPAPSAEQPATAPAVAPAPVAEAKKPIPEKLAAPIEMLRLALTIDTPLAPRPQQTSARSEGSAATKAAPSEPVARAQATQGTARVEKRDRERGAGDRAELEFRRAANLLNSGRVADAEDALIAALDADRTHQAARQTLIALYIEQRRIDEALRHLQQGLEANPTYVPFAVALARVHVDRGNFDEAIKVLEQSRPTAQASPDFHALRGAVLQRKGRHAEAAEAYRQALNSGAQTGTSWVGLGISLEAMSLRREAAEAFRRGVASGTLSPEVRSYAEQRAQYLQ